MSFVKGIRFVEPSLHSWEDRDYEAVCGVEGFTRL